MEYFKHTYNGIEYDFEPNRASQSRIDAMQKETRTTHSEKVEKLLRYEPKIKRLEAEKERLNTKLSSTTDENESLKIQEQLEKIVDEETTILVECEKIKDQIDNGNIYEDQMFILLQEQRDENYQKKYPDLTKELFENICFDIEHTYGHDEYEELCAAICEDVFTTAEDTEKAEYKSQYLRNRKKK